MIKFLVIGDTHFKKDNLVESELLCSKLIEKAIEVNKEIDAIILLGDIFDKHETINTEVLTMANEFLHKLSEISELFILIGNHDRPNNSNFLTNKHALNSLKYWKNTYIIDKVEIHYIKDKSFLFVPYVPPGRFMEAINTIIMTEQPLCIFAHQEFYGSCFSSNITSQVGDKWPDNFPMVISGHIHTYNKLQNNILYIGTPIQQTYGDNPDKTISIITFEETNYIEERIDLLLPKKLEYNLECQELLNWSPPENSKCRVILHGDSANMKSTMMNEHVKTLKLMGVTILQKITNNINNSNEVNKSYKSMRYIESLYNNINKIDNKLIYIFNKFLI